MAVVIETTLGDITVDLYLDQRPVTCLNFLKLCKMKYYNFNLFHSIRSGFIAQTGDPTAVGTGGESIWGILEGPQKRFFSGEKMPKIRHTDAGLLSMVCTDDMMVGSQFFFTLAPDLDSLDGTHCVIGEVTEGQEVLTKLNEVICDETHRPYRDVRITHTVVLEDPFSDPPGLRAPSRSPSPSAERLKGGRIAPDEEIDETEGKSAAEIQELIDEKEAKARATILEIVGDLPDADIAPPENVLFVCKLNPVTTDDDLEIIFSRFGKIVSCEVIRDKTSGNSLQYAFIEFDDKKSCEDAYFKMDNVLIDDRRIHVDFSQSVSKMRWLGKGRGVQYFNENEQEVRNKDKKRDTDHERNNIEIKQSKKEHYSNNRKHQIREENDKTEKERDRRYEKGRSSKTVHRRSRSRSRNNSRDRVKNGDSRKLNESRSYDKKYHRNNVSSQNRQISQLSPYESEKRISSKHREGKGHSEKSNYADKDYDRRHIKSHKSHENSTRNRLEKPKSSNEVKESKKKSCNTNAEPKTPSPVTDRKRNLKKKNTREKVKSSKKTEKCSKEGTNKRKRKASTSSSNSDTSESSSSSSESSSSSNSDTKKRKVRRKRRKQSTSSSSDSSRSSTSSSSTPSSSETSSSDSEPRKNKSKKNSNKKVKKSRKK